MARPIMTGSCATPMQNTIMTEMPMDSAHGPSEETLPKDITAFGQSKALQCMHFLYIPRLDE